MPSCAVCCVRSRLQRLADVETRQFAPFYHLFYIGRTATDCDWSFGFIRRIDGAALTQSAPMKSATSSSYICQPTWNARCSNFRNSRPLPSCRYCVSGSTKVNDTPVSDIVLLFTSARWVTVTSMNGVTRRRFPLLLGCQTANAGT